MTSRLLTVVFFAVAVITVWTTFSSDIWADRSPIRVGILHSLTGTMAISERSVVDSTRLAIEEINEQGGIRGRKIVPIVRDGRSDWPTFAAEAERLITRERVVTIFGCWTSASRKMVKPVVERYRHLLIYPVQYEGVESSPNIVYTGASPNQQIIPAVKWCLDNVGNRFFLVGSDYVFPRTANAIIRDQVRSLRGQIVGEEYLLLGSRDVDTVVREIGRVRPDVILNTINGDTNVAFFRRLRSAGITAKAIPTMSFSIAEQELQDLPRAEMVGDYAAWNYFQSVDSPANRRYVERFKSVYGQDRVTDDPMEAAYFGVHLWAQAVREAGTDETAEIRTAIRTQSMPAPEGIVYIDPENQHAWKPVRIGRIRANGQFEVVWSSEKPVRPEPYPLFRSRKAWDSLLDSLYRGWGDRWANPGPPTQH